MLKIFYQKNNDEDEDGKDEGKSGNGGGLLGGLSGLRVARKQIISRDWKVVRRVYTAIQNYQRRSTLI